MVSHFFQSCLSAHNLPVKNNLQVLLTTVLPLIFCQLFEPGTRWPQAGAPGFLKLIWFTRTYVCACLFVCPILRALITSGVIWCDIDHV